MPFKFLRIKKLLFILTVCCLAVSFNTLAQTQHFYFTNYGVKDGMSHGVVDDLFRDSEGFLWIATYNGLDRFDGTNFKVFHADYRNRDAIVDDYVQQICEDQEGNIWCGCDQGVSCYEKKTGKFRNYRLSNPKGLTVDANHVSQILCDRHGIIWCGTSAGIFKFDKKLNTFKGYFHSEININSPSNDLVFKNAFLEDLKTDGIWIAGPNGINYFNTVTNEFLNYRHNPNNEPVFTNDVIYPITFNKDGNLVFVKRGESSLYCYNPASKKLLKELIYTNDGDEAPKNIASLFFDSKNNCWMSTWTSKLYFKGEEAHVYQRMLHDEQNANSINSNFFWDVLEDPDGSLWFGGVNGISVFRPSAQFYSLLKPNASLPPDKHYKRIDALYQAADSLLWLGTDAGLYLYNLQNGNCEKMERPGDRHYAANFIFKVDGALWLGDYNSLNIFDFTRQKFVSKEFLPNEMKNKFGGLTNAYQCRNGDIWVLTEEPRELFHLKKSNGKWIHYKHNEHDPHSVSSNVTPAFCEEKNGTVWFGSIEDGLMRYDEKNDQFDFFRYAYSGSQKRPIINVGGIKDGSNGILYLIPNRLGLVKFDYKDSSATFYKQSDGLATASNFEAGIDSTGNLWMAGYQDVTRYDKAKNLFTRFHIDYANDNYLYANVLTVLRDGTVVISVLDGLAVYHPDMMGKEELNLKVLISDFSVFEKNMPFTQKKPNIKLNYKQNFFSIGFSAFSGSHTPLQYAYKLTGFDQDWVYSGKRQFAAYTNVPGGDYTFLVKASAGDGQWSSPTTIHISVAPPFWQTIWFKIISFSLAVLLVVLIFKIRERNYRAKQEQKLQVLKVRDKIAQDLHDDIGASLSSIRMYSEALRMQVKEKLPQTAMILERISENSKEIVENMSDIVWAINPKNDSLQFMEDRMHAFASGVCSSKNIVTHFNKISFAGLKLPMETRKNIFLIFKEAVNNACKYACCQNIFITMEKENGWLVLTIADDGEGFDTKNASNGNGLTNMQKRAHELNGVLSLKSTIHEGTAVKLSVPVANIHSRLPLSGE